MIVANSSLFYKTIKNCLLCGVYEFLFEKEVVISMHLYGEVEVVIRLTEYLDEQSQCPCHPSDMEIHTASVFFGV